MIKVLFVCHGNICRSTMAEFLFKYMVEKEGIADKFVIASAATSREEIGNPVHPGTRKKLEPLGINVAGKKAVQITEKDMDYYDYILIMDDNNKQNLIRMFGVSCLSKVYRLKILQTHGTPATMTLPSRIYTAAVPLFSAI